MTDNHVSERQSPRQSPPEQREEDAQPQIPLVRQNSIMSLTLDDIEPQSMSENILDSIGIDEFLNSVCFSTNVDDTANNTNNNNFMSQAFDPFNGNGGPMVNMIEDHDSSGAVAFGGQNCYFISTPMCNKTVDEIWDEIQAEGQRQPNFDQAARIIRDQQSVLKRRSSVEEMMTLEDFLIRAGVVQGEPRNVRRKIEEIVPDVQHQVHAPIGPYIGGNCNDGSNFSPLFEMIANSDVAFGVIPYNLEIEQKTDEFPVDGPFQMVAQSDIIGVEYSVDFGCDSTVGNDVAEIAGTSRRKKRISPDGTKEAAIDRRQRRMIKNRESAARSRARKQAYTVDLEFELNHIKEDNERIKQFLIEEEEKKLGKMVIRLRKMRRTQSWFW